MLVAPGRVGRVGGGRRVARRNLLTFAREFDNAVWTKSNGAVTADAAVAPDGSTTADLLLGTSGSNAGRAIQTFSGLIGESYELSVIAKSAGGTLVRLYLDDGGTNVVSVTYNTSTGAVSSAAAVTGGNWIAAASISESLGSGWWRFTLTFKAVGVAPTRVALWHRDTSDGVNGIYLWDAWLTAGRRLRTNMLLRSQELDNASWTQAGAAVTANAVAASDGTITAEFVREDSSSGSHQINQAVTTVAGPATLSIEGKADARSWIGLGLTDSGGTVRISYFNLGSGVVGTAGTGCTLSIVNLGGGWYRCIVTLASVFVGANRARVYLSTGDGNTSYTGNGASGLWLSRAQLEPDDSATANIPTTSAAVSTF